MHTIGIDYNDQERCNWSVSAQGICQHAHVRSHRGTFAVLGMARVCAVWGPHVHSRAESNEGIVSQVLLELKDQVERHDFTLSETFGCSISNSRCHPAWGQAQHTVAWSSRRWDRGPSQWKTACSCTDSDGRCGKGTLQDDASGGTGRKFTLS